ncbi:hypothetical protein AAGS40_30185 (plasmid) [Paraburkholderia sp. PREW-6R]|uniref:hypothetical protein n=1 Tax=Paraburkholderia sp. PREW-6R TaxID=3141544 RepID=UPI0031F56678
MLYGVGERGGAAAWFAPFLGDRVLDAQPLEKPFCDFPAGFLVAVHLPDSVDRACDPRIDNNAMFVVLPDGRCGRGIG